MTDDQILMTVMAAAGAAGVPVLLWGEPGVGKSALVEGLAADTGAHLEVVVGSTCEPADLNGLPVVSDDGNVSFAPRAFVHRLNAAERGLLFLDELSTAPPASQAAMLRVVRERWVGEVRLAGHVRILAAANPADQAADGWDLAPPMANRFMHLDYAPSTEAWFDGITNGWHRLQDAARSASRVGPRPDVRASVVGFLRARPQLLQVLPRDGGDAGRAWPSRRTWSYLIDVLEQLPAGDDDLSVGAPHLAASGLVGEAAGIELASFLQHLDLPDPELLLGDPSSTPVDELRTDQLYALLGSVVSAAGVDRPDRPERWAAACDVLGEAVTSGRGDIALPLVNRLLADRPDGATSPHSLVTAMLPMLRASGGLRSAA